MKFTEYINPTDINVIDLNKEKFLFFFTAYDSLKQQVEYDKIYKDGSIKVQL